MSVNVPKVCFFLRRINIESGVHRARDPLAALRNPYFTAFSCAFQGFHPYSFCVEKQTFWAFLLVKIQRVGFRSSRLGLCTYSTRASNWRMTRLISKFWHRPHTYQRNGRGRSPEGSQHLNEFQFPRFMPKLRSYGGLSSPSPPTRRGFGNASFSLHCWGTWKLFLPQLFEWTSGKEKHFENNEGNGQHMPSIEQVFLCVWNFKIWQNFFVNVSYMPFGIQDASK